MRTRSEAKVSQLKSLAAKSRKCKLLLTLEMQLLTSPVWTQLLLLSLFRSARLAKLTTYWGYLRIIISINASFEISNMIKSSLNKLIPTGLSVCHGS